MSVFTKPFEENEKRLRRFKRMRDDAVYLHFFARCYESFLSRLTPEGTGNSNMFRRMPEYFFNLGMFGVFKQDGALHAWPCGGVGDIDEYGYPTSVLLYSANGKNAAGDPILTDPTPEEKDRVALASGDVVIFRPNRLGVPVFPIVFPILERMTRTVRAIDNITGKRGLSLFGVPDSVAKKVIDDVDAAIEEGKSMLAIRSPDAGTAAVRQISLFGDSGGLDLASLWESLRHYEAFLWETVGENTVAFEKKERLNIPEVESNDERIAHGIFGVARLEMEKGIELCREKWPEDAADWHLPAPEPVEEDPDPDDTDPNETDPETDPEEKEDNEE